MNVSLFEAVGALVASAMAGLVADDALVAMAVLVLLVGLKLVATGDRLFVLPVSYAFHWSQVMLGILYLDATGREVPAIYQSDYRPMVLIGLGCCLAIAIGVRAGLTLIPAPPSDALRPEYAFSPRLLVAAYVATVVFESALTTIAFQYPSIRQIFMTIDTARLGVLFLILRRLLYPTTRWGLVTCVLAVEVGLGMTGFFAGFREPVVLAALAMLEIFDKRKARDWAALSVAAVFTAALGLLWMGIRVDYRREYVDVDSFQSSRSARASMISNLGSEWLRSDSETMWLTADHLVDRMWTVYYPALALKRVPSLMPHTNGEILGTALVHIVTPRVFFPEKPNLQSDSEKVRKYSGVMVAGAERNTSIAFGYAGEAYVDFGLPMMFLPVLLFGVAIGCSYALFRRLIWHREIFVAFATVSFWLSLYLFERSWATMLGVWLGMMIYLGVPIVVLDRFLLIRFFKRADVLEAMEAVERDPAHGLP